MVLPKFSRFRGISGRPPAVRQAKGEETMLYQPKVAEVKAFVRGARKVEKMLERRGGSRIDPAFAIRMIDEIVASARLVEFIPPPDGRVHIVRVQVVLDEPWPLAVKAAGPNTPDDYNIWKVGDQYPPTGAGIADQEFVLLNFGEQGGGFDAAIAWAAQYPVLKRSAPRGVFAISKHKALFHREFQMDPMYVVATEECSFSGERRTPGVWWGGSRRGARVYWVGICGGAHGWFAFHCE